MNEPTLMLETRPEVRAFVDRVRDRLADLTDEEREELVGGLEADLEELVADGGSVTELGDPRAYADELRAAAGVPQGQGRRPRRAVGDALHTFLDVSHARWDELMRTQVAREPWAVVSALRPAWWVLRAWVAVQLLVIVTNNQVMLIPELGGQLMGGVVFVAAAVASVQLGRGKLWLSSDREKPVLGRVVLLLLNGFAILMTLVVLNWFQHDVRTQTVYESAAAAPGLSNGDRPVYNVFAYDAQGRPLQGVQLFDQNGDPLFVAGWARASWEDGSGPRAEVTYPWRNGAQALWHVFPLPTRAQESEFRPADVWTTANPPTLPSHPLAVVPPATLPTPESAAEPNPADGDGDAGVQGGESGAQAQEPANAQRPQPDSEKPRRR